MVIDNRQKDKILAAHFAATSPNDSAEAFIGSMFDKDQYNQLKLWWDDMDALQVIRAAEHYVRNRKPENEQFTEPTKKPSADENGLIQFSGKPIGKIYNYYRTVLPQEMQIKIAYDSLIERFMGFLQREKCAIRLSENELTIRIFVPQTNPNTEFDLVSEWDTFIKFVYSEAELYKSFTLLVNSLKLTDRGFGYVRFPPATKGMVNWLAAFYIATLRERVLRNADNYKKADGAFRKARDNVKKYQDQLNTDSLTEKRRSGIETKLNDENQKLNDAMQNRKSALKVNQKALDQILSDLRHQTDPIRFDHAENLSHQFNRTGSMQFSYGTVKLKSQGAKSSIEDTIVEILNTSITPLSCPFVSLDEMSENLVRQAGDNANDMCYSCGRLLPAKQKHQQANRFVLGDPSQRLQSGGSQTQPSVCGECLTVAFACPVKLTSGAIVVQLAPHDWTDESFSIENHLRMLTLGELNLVAGRYLLINCREFIGSGSNRTLASEKIGQRQYTLWRVACTFPAAALQTMKFTLFTDGTEIPLKKRHFVWLSLLNEIFSPSLVIGQRDNIPLGQAIRLIQKDEVISAIYKLVTAETTEARQLTDWSYSEKRSLEELREKHCDLLKDSSKGDKLMKKQADFYRDVAALTGLTYAYCDSVRRLLVSNRKISGKQVQIEVKKLIEDVANPTGFTYRAAKEFADKKYSDTSAKMVRKDDNYFCYDQAKRLLKDVLELDISKRKDHDDNGHESLKVYYDDILNAYAKLSDEYDKAEWRKLATELKQNLYAKFPFLFRKETNQNGN